MTQDAKLRPASSIERSAVERVVREGLLVVVIVLLTGLGMFLPGTERSFPDSEVVVGDVIVAAGTLAVVATLLYAAPHVRTLITESLHGPADVVAEIASIGVWTLAFVSVLIGHAGFEPVLGPVLGPVWVYDLGFLLLALGSLGMIAVRLLWIVEPFAALVTSVVVDASRPRREIGSEEPTDSE